eukprot:gnl/TRDRNA2_/TRDRNA2_73983_c0_seq1.p1 gnl/TRDRNA2_/TRDRNA2_73983_c0~~gnl/TRDRNA2_/TRDRNA2_73983_c0_seq1.p1  ORF type:complete len:562 (+),score=94.65 gnl/TRDRNA2_/TRDRNA2_73983_c0_seq1:138-1823(+)
MAEKTGGDGLAAAAAAAAATSNVSPVAESPQPPKPKPKQPPCPPPAHLLSTAARAFSSPGPRPARPADEPTAGSSPTAPQGTERRQGETALEGKIAQLMGNIGKAEGPSALPAAEGASVLPPRPASTAHGAGAPPGSFEGPRVGSSSLFARSEAGGLGHPMQPPNFAPHGDFIRPPGLHGALPPGPGPVPLAHPPPPGLYGPPPPGHHFYGPPPPHHAWPPPPGHHGAPPGHHGAPPGHHGAPPGHHGAPPGYHGASPPPPGYHGVPAHPYPGYWGGYAQPNVPAASMPHPAPAPAPEPAPAPALPAPPVQAPDKAPEGQSTAGTGDSAAQLKTWQQKALQRVKELGKIAKKKRGRRSRSGSRGSAASGSGSSYSYSYSGSRGACSDRSRSRSQPVGRRKNRRHPAQPSQGKRPHGDFVRPLSPKSPRQPKSPQKKEPPRLRTKAKKKASPPPAPPRGERTWQSSPADVDGKSEPGSPREGFHAADGFADLAQDEDCGLQFRDEADDEAVDGGDDTAAAADDKGLRGGSPTREIVRPLTNVWELLSGRPGISIAADSTGDL